MDRRQVLAGIAAAAVPVPAADAPKIMFQTSTGAFDVALVEGKPMTYQVRRGMEGGYQIVAQGNLSWRKDGKIIFDEPVRLENGDTISCTLDVML